MMETRKTHEMNLAGEVIPGPIIILSDGVIGEDLHSCGHTAATRLYPGHETYGATQEADGIWRRRYPHLCWSCQLARWQANHPDTEFSYAQHYQDPEFSL